MYSRKQGFIRDVDEIQKSVQGIQGNKKGALPLNQGTRIHKLPFRDSHPGSKFCYLVEMTSVVISKKYLPKEKNCSVERLGVNNDFVTNEVLLEDREDYAMMASLMFCPFRCINDLKLYNMQLEESQERIN